MTNLRVIYVHTIKKYVDYAHAPQKASRLLKKIFETRVCHDLNFCLRVCHSVHHILEFNGSTDMTSGTHVRK
jgi:hypothetical protein